MFKSFLSVVAIVLISANAFAFGDNNNSGVQGDKNHHNTIINGDVSEGADTVVNKNRNKNTNTNTNVQGQQQGQAQGQLQAQGQGQLQGQQQSANNEGNHQDTDITFEGDKRELVSPFYVPQENAELANHADVNAVKVMASLWKHLDGMNAREAEHASKGAHDMRVEFALLYENDFKTTYIHKGASGDFMGYIYVLPTGQDCTLAQMEAKALKEAMKAGANFAVLTSTSGKYLEGSAWNVGLSGGASAFAKGDDIAIAPSGGLGYGKAYSANELRPAVIVALYVQPDLIVEKISKNPDRYEIQR
jgi:hypothetical protein